MFLLSIVTSFTTQYYLVGLRMHTARSSGTWSRVIW